MQYDPSATLPLSPTRPAAAPAVADTIVVDLDGTLLRTDLLYESLVALAIRRPLQLVPVLAALGSGKAAFKRALAERVVPDIATMPLNEELIAWLRQQRDAGANLLLYSASDENLVQPVAERVGFFGSARGSDGRVNLAGVTKHEAIVELHGERFTYIGDSRADLPIWARCKSAGLVGDVEKLRSRLEPGTEVVAEFPVAAAGLRTWRKSLRLHQWAKNALIFVPLLLSGQFKHLHDVLLTLLGFLAFGLLASSTYLVNDLFDLPADRRHRSKRFRPLAAGELSLKNGLLAVPALMLAATVLMLFLPMKFFGVALLYASVTLAYSMGLKRQPILDLLVLAGLFTVRLLAGMVVIGVVVSPWLLTFSMFFLPALRRSSDSPNAMRS